MFLTSSGVIIGVAGIRNTLRATTVLKDNGRTNVVLSKNWQPFKICIADRKGETGIISPRLLIGGFQAVQRKGKEK